MSTRKREYKFDRELNEKLRTRKMISLSDVKDFYMSMSCNVMTPEHITVGSRGDFKHIYEVTQGEGMSGHTVFGLTVHTWNGDGYERNDELSELCSDKDELEIAKRSIR